MGLIFDPELFDDDDEHDTAGTSFCNKFTNNGLDKATAFDDDVITAFDVEDCCCWLIEND